MSRALWVDATHGAAGDMLLGALLDAGADPDRVRGALGALADAGSEPIELTVEQVRRHGLRASRAVVTAPPSTVRRGPADVSRLLEAAALCPAALSPAAARFAHAVFDALADAESRVHGVERERVHFHEVGALDALADVVGCAVALDSLRLLGDGVLRRVSTVGLGGGTVRTDHGRMPVPVPATLELLARAGAPVDAGPGDRELCTPTGAALLATLATDWGSLPRLAVHAVGSGAGTADPADRPNLLRVVVGDRVDAASDGPGWRSDDLLVVESTVDDLDPRLWPGVLDGLCGSGAHDAWLTPVLMRHGRPGHVVTALCGADTLDAVSAALVGLTTTLGLRVHGVSRRALARDRVEVDLGGVVVGVKRGLLSGRPLTVQPEFAEAATAARTLGVPVADILDRARTAALEQAREEDG